MPTKAKLKFKGLPWYLEHKLITKLGFRIYSRNKIDNWIVVEKVRSAFQPEVLINGELPEDIQNALNKRCSTIVGHFDDPELHLDIIRTRLHNVAQTLPILQGKYIESWCERNLKENQ